MAGLSWDAVTRSDKYLQLDEEGKLAAKKEYFRRYVAPNVPKEKWREAWDSLESYTPERTWGEVGKEAAGTLGKAATLVGQLGTGLVESGPAREALSEQYRGSEGGAVHDRRHL